MIRNYYAKIYLSLFAEAVISIIVKYLFFDRAWDYFFGNIYCGSSELNVIITPLTQQREHFIMRNSDWDPWICFAWCNVPRTLK